MQMVTGSEVTFIPRNFWERIGKLILRKSSLLLRQFHGSVIKTFGYFKGSLELEDKFEMILIIVTTCKKNHGLLGNDVRNINSTKLINEIKMKKIGKLKNFKVSLKFKKKSYPFLLWGTKITSKFVAISSSKTTKINRTEPSWTYSPRGS